VRAFMRMMMFVRVSFGSTLLSCECEWRWLVLECRGEGGGSKWVVWVRVRVCNGDVGDVGAGDEGG
jgi:hypothetical protein